MSQSLEFAEPGRFDWARGLFVAIVVAVVGLLTVSTVLQLREEDQRSKILHQLRSNQEAGFKYNGCILGLPLDQRNQSGANECARKSGFPGGVFVSQP